MENIKDITLTREAADKLIAQINARVAVQPASRADLDALASANKQDIRNLAHRLDRLEAEVRIRDQEQKAANAAQRAALEARSTSKEAVHYAMGSAETAVCRADEARAVCKSPRSVCESPRTVCESPR